MSKQTPDDACYHLEEGHLAIDFINTGYITFDEAAPFGYTINEDELTDLPALGAWGFKVGLLDEAEMSLLSNAADTPNHKARLTDLIDVRESLRRIIRAEIGEDPLPRECLDKVNHAISQVIAHSCLASTDDGFRVQMTGGPAGSVNQVFDHVIWAVGKSTIELMTNPKELAMISECPGEDCGYLFRDTSHGRRRWCSMKSCGNRAKVQAFRDRQKVSA